jgi:hypothetical protein
MGMDWVFDCLRRPVAGVREREARSGSSSDRFLHFMDRCRLPGPGDMEAFLGAGGLFALDAELPMFCQCGVGVKLARYWCRWRIAIVILSLKIDYVNSASQLSARYISSTHCQKYMI